MRAFIIIAHKFRGDINLNDLPGSGRIDVVARAINSAIFLSHDIRRDVLFFTYFPRMSTRLKIDSSEVKYLNPDERSTAALIRNAIMQVGSDEVRSSPGFYVKRESFEDLLREISSSFHIHYLREDGEDIRDVEFSSSPAFILSDSVDLSEEEENLVLKHSKATVSVGPRSILASHAITIVHNELDRRGL